MTHDQAWRLLPDIITAPDDVPDRVRSHVASCHICQRQLFRLQRVDRLLRSDAFRGEPARGRRRGFVRWVAAVAMPLLAAVAFAVYLAVAPPGVSAMALRSASGIAVANAQIRDVGDGQVVELTPGDGGLSGTTSYVLWGRTASHPNVRLGMFMSSPTGTCRARFRMRDHLHWQRFWITPAANRGAVVAQTSSS